MKAIPTAVALMIAGGFAIIGIGGKIEKTKNVLAAERRDPGETAQDRH